MARFTILLLVLGVAASPAAAAGVERFTLDNGVRVVLHPFPKSGGVTVAIAFSTGREHDPAGAEGLAHLIEHMLIRAPVPSHPKHGEALEALGGFNRVNGATMLGATYYYVMTDAENLPRILALQTEQVRSAKITTEGIAAEAKRIRDGEIAAVERRTAFVLLSATMNAAYPGHGLGHPSVLGEKPDEQTAEFVAKRFASTLYGPARLVVAITGDFDAATVRAQLVKTLGAIPRREGEVPAAPPVGGAAEGATSVRIDSPAGDASACFVYDAPGIVEEGHLAAGVAAQILQMKVFSWRADPERPNDPIAMASTGAEFHAGTRGSALAVWLTRKSTKGRDALVAKWNDTLAALAEKGVSAGEVASMKTGLAARLKPEGQAMAIAMTPEARRSMAVAQLAIFHAISESSAGGRRDEIEKALAAVDAEAVNAVLRRWAKNGPRAEGRTK